MAHLDLSTYKPTNGVTSDAGAIDNALDAIQTFVNTLRDNVDALTGTPSLPTGAMVPYGAAAAPAGWLACDGSAVSRATYSALFGVIATTYGVGDGSTTFNLPDMRGRVPVGYAASGGHADVSTLGASDGQAAANRRPKHRTTNALTLPNHTHGLTSVPNDVTAGGVSSQWAPGATVVTEVTATGNPTSLPAIGGSVGTNVANDALDTPSYVVHNYVIKT